MPTYAEVIEFQPDQRSVQINHFCPTHGLYGGRFDTAPPTFCCHVCANRAVEEACSNVDGSLGRRVCMHCCTEDHSEDLAQLEADRALARRRRPYIVA